MSYPPPGPPGNDPYAQNPYAQQPPQPPTAPYGYPQQPQPGGQPAYGYPQAAPPPGPGGFPGPPPGMMPSKINGVRVMMFIAGGLQTLVSIAVMIVLGVAAENLHGMPGYASAHTPIGVLYIFFGVCLVHAVLGIVLGVFVAKGGSSTRTGGIVWASFLTLFGLPFVPLGLVWMALGITCIVLLAQEGAWFNRPRY